MTNYEAIKTISAKLVEVFAPYDADVLENSKKWALARREALKAFKESDEAKALLTKRDSWGYYDRLFAISGGKTWYNVINYNSSTGIEEFVTKNCAATVAKRNASIALKLEKAAVTEIVSEEYVNTHDGFNGLFVVNTDNGKKVVRIDTIVAGGYNIQCRHMRVLVKVK